MSTVAIIALASAFVTHATAHTPTASMEPALLTTLALALGDGAIAAADGHAVDAAHAVHSTSGYADVGPLHFVKAVANTDFAWLKWMLLAPLVSVILCGAMAMFKVKGRLPALFTVATFGLSTAMAIALYFQFGPTLFATHAPLTVPFMDWLSLTWGPGPFQSFTANLGFYIDGISMLWMLFVTVLATLIALYASEYMESDLKAGYARFFFAVSLFVTSMLILVMSDNLVGLYLGWEGVGLCSYMLIGYYATQPGATAAAKKAFIMNRIGDLGLALAIFLIWTNYGTVQYDSLFQAIAGSTSEAVQGGWSKAAIPFLLLLAVCGKSAQGPLFTWLPDAMWGPTPVSALIHAATMVTAGIYLLARMAPFYTVQAIGPEWAETALLTVGWIGCFTAFIGATIACGQFDYKRVFAYSTISSLGYMVMGLGVGTAFGGVYYVFTHAWFKALLFLTAGAVMHGMAGQVDFRKLGGLLRVPGFRLTMICMLLGCLWLATAPFSAAAESKDIILLTALTSHVQQVQWMGWIGVLTAGITAYYAFRVWFRLALGPVKIEPGADQHADHGHDDHAGHTDHAHGSHAHSGADAHAGHGAAHGGGAFHPHAPGFRISLVLTLLAIGSVLAGLPSYLAHSQGFNWIQRFVQNSSAWMRAGNNEEHGQILGRDAHSTLFVIATSVVVAGFLLAWILHAKNRALGDRLRASMLNTTGLKWIPLGSEHGWYVDQFYNAIIGIPAWLGAQLLAFTDRFVIDGVIVAAIGRFPGFVARVFQPLYTGTVQSYALTMAGGIGLIVAWVVWVWLSGGAS
jgi:NADH-quinone oxidoreductase subunit L